MRVEQHLLVFVRSFLLSHSRTRHLFYRLSLTRSRNNPFISVQNTAFLSQLPSDMASQVQTITEAAQDKVHGYTSDALSTVDASVANITEWGQGLLDRFFPPEQRAAVWARLQEFMLANPKLSVCIHPSESDVLIISKKLDAYC